MTQREIEQLREAEADIRMLLIAPDRVTRWELEQHARNLDDIAQRAEKELTAKRWRAGGYA